ncbi:hypothetical protein Tco_1130134 [Tanacetum coccineum]
MIPGTNGSIARSTHRGYEDAIVVPKISPRITLILSTSSTSTLRISSDVAELKDMVKALILDKKNQSPAPTPVKAVVQHPTYQAPAYQAPAPQIQGVSKEDFQAYVKANDAVMRNMQTQGQNMQNQLTNLTDMLSKFVTSNTASTSGTLPSNTVTNPKEDLKGITTRSGVAYQGPTIRTTSSPKVVEREPEVKKDTMLPTNNGSTEDVQPPVVPVVHHESISEPFTWSSFFEPDHEYLNSRGGKLLKTSRALIDNWTSMIRLVEEYSQEVLVSQMGTVIFFLFKGRPFSAIEDDPTSPKKLEKNLKFVKQTMKNLQFNDPPEVETQGLATGSVRVCILEGNDNLPDHELQKI